MDSTRLLEWLMTEKKMTIRSAKDVLSRCGRIYRMLDIGSIDRDTMETLQNNEEFRASSMFIKSQLKRTVTLCLEFMNSLEKD